MNTAIIVAAGSGERFKSEVPKQFLEINGKPVIVHTLERISAAPSIDAVVLVLAADRVAEYEARRGEFPKLAAVVKGGASRAESVLSGLNAVPDGCDLVAVHDGARPLVSVADIEAVVAKAVETGAACLVAAVTDTIKSVRGGEIAATLDRDKLRRALTPQAFRIEILKRAFETPEVNDSATDESYLVEKLGHPVAFVEGSPRNIKITGPDDLIYAKALLGCDP
ncbi:MAG: 2-C-methyl-D-erythritol 4-phosphate cytidylyltransferase [Pyrinomonadaceae bacterium]